VWNRRKYRDEDYQQLTKNLESYISQNDVCELDKSSVSDVLGLSWFYKFLSAASAALFKKNARRSSQRSVQQFCLQL